MNLLKARQEGVLKQKEEEAVNLFSRVGDFREFITTSQPAAAVTVTLTCCCLSSERVNGFKANLDFQSGAVYTFRNGDGVRFYADIAKGSVWFKCDDNDKIFEEHPPMKTHKLTREVLKKGGKNKLSVGRSSAKSAAAEPVSENDIDMEGKEGEDSHDSRGNQRQQFFAFVEYDDVRHNVYICRSSAIQVTQTECVLDHCSTGHKCGNQRMQQGVQAALALDSTPGKGIALMADDLIEKGEFVAYNRSLVIGLIGFAGQIVGSRHSYDMAVTANEVIDARYGIARFANHSCFPNCDVERWEVVGEVCCGLFANRTITRGEEITIRYGAKFVRSKVR
ncbi:Histone-lysine N-methyltransferase [Phytophthora nicotianae]|uniref:Histone-lysine N-methyltransferase n=2 Tax=Phytophthora nicotianae TaxID=4792 RepID=A0A0W8C8H0_PHYNI|nr:Histone-lysine N-methyltransferase [Phytophthora nicotianae]